MREEDNVPDERFVMPHRNLQIALLCVAYVLLFTVTFDIIALYYWVKLGIECCCVIVAGFMMGFTPLLHDRSMWSHSYIFIAPAPLFISASSNLAGIYDLPMEQRSAVMGSSAFLMPLLLLMGLHSLGIFIGKAAFRRFYPDQTAVIISSQDEQVETPPEVKRFLRRSFLAIFLGFIPSIVALIWFRHLYVPVMLASVAMMMCVVSFITGRRWSISDRSAKILWLSLVAIGPVAMFVGQYFGAADHNMVFHVAKALRFVGILLGVMVVPAVVGRVYFKESEEVDD